MQRVCALVGPAVAEAQFWTGNAKRFPSGADRKPEKDRVKTGVSHQQHGRAGGRRIVLYPPGSPPLIANVTGLNKRERGLYFPFKKGGGTWKGGFSV